MFMSAPLTWDQVTLHLQRQPMSTITKLAPPQVQHPRDAGLHPSIGVPVGQRTDYRKNLPNGTQLCILDFGTHYEAKLEPVLRLIDIESILRQAPGTSAAGSIATGALLGLAIGRSKEAALIGAVIGGLVGVVGVALANAETSPRVSDIASDLFSKWRLAP